MTRNGDGPGTDRAGEPPGAGEKRNGSGAPGYGSVAHGNGSVAHGNGSAAPGNGSAPRRAGRSPRAARRLRATGRGPRAAGLRRVLDIVLAGLLLVVSAPILVAAATAVLLTSGRPVLYAHRRIGRSGRPFRCFKLRTMEVDAESRLSASPVLRRRYVENGYKLPTAEDPRVTPVGRWLRATYIDELPQLFNVLGGSMSLVGPRPVVEDELTEFEPDVSLLLTVRPGIFGAWTSRGHRRPAYPERASLELEYARDPSLRRDLRILVRSLPVVLRGQQPGD